MATQVLREMYQLTRGEVPIIACGGVSNGYHAYEKIKAGRHPLAVRSCLTFGAVLPFKCQPGHGMDFRLDFASDGKQGRQHLLLQMRLKSAACSPPCKRLVLCANRRGIAYARSFSSFNNHADI